MGYGDEKKVQEGRDIHILGLTLVVVQQKLTQRCKAIILQLN